MKNREQTHADCHRQETRRTATGRTRHATINANLNPETGEVKRTGYAHDENNTDNRREETRTTDGRNSTDLVREARERRNEARARSRRVRANRLARALNRERRKDTHERDEKKQTRRDTETKEETTEAERQAEEPEKTRDHVWSRADRSNREDAQAQAQEERDNNDELAAEAKAGHPVMEQDEDDRVYARADELRAEQGKEARVDKLLRDKARREAEH